MKIAERMIDMLKRLLSCVAGAVLFVSMPVAALAAERYEVLQIGDEDAWVMELQERLIEEGYLKVAATGYYGTNTQNAVISYQRDHGLSVDGKAGPVTRKDILGDDYREITGPRDSQDKPEESAAGQSSDPADPDSSESAEPEATKSPVSTESGTEPADENDEGKPSAEPSSKPSTSSSAETLQLGDKGEAISELQELLREHDYYDYGSITGYFGPITKDAVLRFQRTYGLTEDGIVGPEAQAILNSGSIKYYALHEGDQGDDVKELQQRLKKLGYLTGSITGYYGDVTRTAVEVFQESNGLSVDGTAGKDTRGVLFSDDAVKADSAVTAAKPKPSLSVQADDPANDDESKPEQQESSGTTSKLQKFLSVAEGRIGKSYVYGAVGPNSFDCSGFVYYALKGAGVGVSRLSSAGYASYSNWETVTSKKDLKIGDLVFFRSDSSSSISHVGIYLGGGNFIHAAPSLKGVGYSTMSSGYYSRNFVSGKRVF